MRKKKKNKKKKINLPQVNIDHLEYFRRAYSNWIPVGRMPKFKLKSVTEKDVTYMIIKL